MFKRSKLMIVSLAIVSALFLAGCGKQVQVPPAYVGKILTKDGFKEGNVKPSKFRLERCWAYCDSLVLLELSDRPVVEKFSLFMPKDQLNMDFEVRLTMAVDSNYIDQLYDKVPSNNKLISFDAVYETYAKPIVRDVIRSVLAEYTINQVASSREALSAELDNAVKIALESAPTKLLRLGLADVQFPKVIADAKIQAAQRREEVEREKAQFEIQRVTMERES